MYFTTKKKEKERMIDPFEQYEKNDKAHGVKYAIILRT